MPFTRNGIEIRSIGEPHDGSQPLPRRRAGAVSVRQALLEITHARAAVDRQTFQIASRSPIAGAEEDFAAGRVLEQIRARFGHDNRDLFGAILVETHIQGYFSRYPPRLRGLA